jgi:hypothetical protein
MPSGPTSRPVTAESVFMVADQSDWMTRASNVSRAESLVGNPILTALEAELSL